MSEHLLAPARALSEKLGYQESAQRLRQAAMTTHLERQLRANRPERMAPADLDWSRLAVQASEPTGYFFSENLVSNESEFLRAAPALTSLPSGLAYLGVGPEPMLSYLGLVDTPLAFVIDIRRDNARLHYLYRAAFECAKTRCEWLALLLGRPYRPEQDPGSSASVDEVLATVHAQPSSEVSFREAHAQLTRALDRLPPHRLPFDRRRMCGLHRYFWRYGTELTFQLGGLRLRRYPTLENMLRATTPDGHPLGFLACERTFRRISALERGSRVVPVVGDISGRALLRFGAELRARGLRVGAIYISNVEQYLFENNVWSDWVTNLEQLPWHSDALLIRSYFENHAGPVPDPPKSLVGQLRRTGAVAWQLRSVKGELPVHQMRTIVHRASAFLERQRRQSYLGFRELVCDETLRGSGS